MVHLLYPSLVPHPRPGLIAHQPGRAGSGRVGSGRPPPYKRPARPPTTPTAPRPPPHCTRSRCMRTLASNTARGYGIAHIRARERYARAMDRDGPIRCACTRPECARHDELQCPEMLDNDRDWDLGHTDDRTAWTGPECVPCNRGAGARRATQVRVQAQKLVKRDW